MKRSGRSWPAGPAITPQASSGWSARACATILSRSAGWSVSMDPSVPSGPGPRPGRRAGWICLPEGPDEGLLQEREPVVDPHVRGAGIGRVEVLHPGLEVLGDRQPDPEGQPDVVERP